MFLYDEAAVAALPRIRKTMAMVPSAHIAHDRLKAFSLDWIKGDSDASLGHYEDSAASRIVVNARIVESKKELSYSFDGSEAPLPMLQATVLHEIGHSVDTKAGIMVGDLRDEGLGGWVSQEDWGILRDVLLAALPASFAEYQEAARQALGSLFRERRMGELAEELPDGLVQELRQLEEVITRRMQMAVHWGKPLEFAGRSYQWEGSMTSYAMSARQRLTVRSYQWRSPAEWFAELYAVSWSLRKPIPGVHPRVARFLYRGEDDVGL